MAPFREHRTHSRISCRIPLECLPWKSSRPFSATVYNVSDDGAYIETSHEVKPGENILIHLARNMPDEIAEIVPNENAGMVRWSRPMRRGRNRLYGAGVRFYYPELMDNIDESSSLKYYCDMCGRSLSLGDIRQHQGLIWMCPLCSDYIEGLPEVLYNTASRYLIGNVL
jgi:hypothetical protein